MAHPMSEPWVNWQPIETAPTNGSAILVCYNDDVVAEAYYDETGDHWWLANTAEHDFDPSRPIYPTHWTSMPTAPLAPVSGKIAP